MEKIETNLKRILGGKKFVMDPCDACLSATAKYQWSAVKNHFTDIIYKWMPDLPPRDDEPFSDHEIVSGWVFSVLCSLLALPETAAEILFKTLDMNLYCTS